MVYLLDANVVIALTIEEHEHHQQVATWLATVERIALFPIVEGALVRYLLRVGGSINVAQKVLRRLYGDPRCEFWPAAASYADADLTQVRGYRQVTDAYLVASAAARSGARLATLDTGLAREWPTVALLVPAR